MNDLRFAFRQLLKYPGFTAVAVLTLALGIGATTAIFSLVNGILLKPLPYEQPEQLVSLWERSPKNPRYPVSSGAVMDWREHSTLFEGLSVLSDWAGEFSGAGRPDRVNGLRVGADFFHILHGQLQLGRGFRPEEDQVGSDNKVIVLAHGLWQRRFGGNTNLIGQTILFDGESRIVVGILRPQALPTENDVGFLIPAGLGSHESDRTNRGWHSYRVIGRLKSGVTPEMAQAELASIRQRLEAEYPSHERDWSVSVVPLHEQVTGDMKPALWVLLGAVGCVLLVACANVANLLLSRAVARQREMAVRAALGASRWRIIRQVLTESLVLAGLGGALGVLIAYGGLEVLLGWSEGPLRRLAEAHVDGRILAFTLLIALGTGVGFGLLPALQLSGPDLGSVLKAGGRSVAAGSRGKLQSGLIVVEVALALMLLTGAGLLMRSFARLTSVSTGFVAEGVLALDLSLPDARFPSNTARAGFVQRLMDRIAAVPGVDTAGFTVNVPMQGWSSVAAMQVVGRQNQSDPIYFLRYDAVAGDYFQALGIRLLRGRTFSRADNSTNASPVAVCNESVVRKVFPNEDPLGQFIHCGNTQFEIVGVVADVKQTRLDDDRADRIYFPHVRHAADGSLLVRTHVGPASLAGAIRQAILEVDSDQPVSNVRTLEQDIARSVATRRHTVTLLGLFAGVALGLAALGLYGILAHAVELRRNEIGIRIALGAQRTDVFRLVLRHGLELTLMGLAIGFVGALALTRILQSQLYEVGPTDPITFSAVALMLVIAAALACWLPARRAARVDPINALRSE
jgi:predicted permease